MTKIVAARFETEAEAQRALDRLRRAGFTGDALARFHVTPPGQHAMSPIGGDAWHDRGTRGSGPGAVIGAIAGAFVLGFAGLAILTALEGRAPFGLVLGTLAATAVGAYAGSLMGTMFMARPPDTRAPSASEPVGRKAGPLVAARIDRPEQLHKARDTFVELHALDIEQAEGTLRDGDWVDFDPRLPARIIVAPTPRSTSNPRARTRSGEAAG